MNPRFLLYALIVTVVTTFASWGSMFKSTANTGSGSSWSSYRGGGGSYGGGYGGGGGHK